MLLRAAQPKVDRVAQHLHQILGTIQAGDPGHISHQRVGQLHQPPHRFVPWIFQRDQCVGQRPGSPDGGEPLWVAVRRGYGDTPVWVTAQRSRHLKDHVVSRAKVIHREDSDKVIRVDGMQIRSQAQVALDSKRVDQPAGACRQACGRTTIGRSFRDDLHLSPVRRPADRGPPGRTNHHRPTGHGRRQRPIDQPHPANHTQCLVDAAQTLTRTPGHHHEMMWWWCRMALHGVHSLIPRGRAPQRLRSRRGQKGQKGPDGATVARWGMPKNARTHPVTVLRGGHRMDGTTADRLATEEPLELRLDGRVLTTTMRTPGDDVELAHGWLLAEGIISNGGDVRSAQFDLGVAGDDSMNVLDVSLAPGMDAPPPERERLTTTTSSCGICGTSALDAIAVSTRYPPHDDSSSMTSDVVVGLPDLLRADQYLFDQTGGTHGAGLATCDGSMIAVREDVGRHNAVDKVIGWAVIQNLMPLTGRALVLSGRAGFELVQKAAMAGIPVVVAVGAPTALAVEVANHTGITLVGFVRDRGANIYSRPDRIIGCAEVERGKTVEAKSDEQRGERAGDPFSPPESGTGGWQARESHVGGGCETTTWTGNPPPTGMAAGLRD